MNILALDTSTPFAAVALGLSDGSALIAPSDSSQRHGRGLLPSVRDLLRRAGLDVADLDALAVGLGPGSYTGLRVGVTALKTLAYAANKPLVGLDSFRVLAENAPDEALHVAVIADAQRGDLYAADYSRDHPSAPLVVSGPLRIDSISTWRGRLSADAVVLGPALDRPDEGLADFAFRSGPSRNHPEGGRLLKVAREAILSGRRDDPWYLEPIYVRRSAAEDQWERNRPA